MRKIIWVIGVLRRTVVCHWQFNNQCGGHLQSQVIVLILVKNSKTLESDFFSCLQETNTSTDRLLDQTSYNPISHKVATVWTLTRRAQLLATHMTVGLTKQSIWTPFLLIKNYSTDFIEYNTYVRPNDSSNNSYTTTATIPSIWRTSETIACILRPSNIRVAHKPMFTLRCWLTNVKGKDKPEDRPGAVYKIKCFDCQVT